MSFELIKNGNKWKQVVEHHICLISDESRLIIFSKSGMGTETGRGVKNGTIRRPI